jgi:hypothetical protein
MSVDTPHDFVFITVTMNDVGWLLGSNRLLFSGTRIFSTVLDIGLSVTWRSQGN